MRLSRIAVPIALSLVLALLYAPLLPPVVAFFSTIPEGGHLLTHYRSILNDPVLVGGIVNTLVIALLVAVLTSPLALAVARTIREGGHPRLVLGVALIPPFVPGVSMGLATALFFRLLGVEPSIATMTAVQLLGALPFATLVLPTVMARFDETYLEAAYMLGSNRLRAFVDIELPAIAPGLVGAATFSLILSLNETARASILQGGGNTVQTYL